VKDVCAILDIFAAQQEVEDSKARGREIDLII